MAKPKKAPSILWYDVETSGQNRRWDRIIQVCAIRTNESLEEIDDPLVMLVRLPPEVVPDPEATCVHGLTPAKLAEEGISELESANYLLEEFSKPNTCIAGYNNIGFDDEFIRFLFYRNLINPYSHESRNGNSRLDLIRVLRLAAAFRPDGIKWPEVDGARSFRLEHLAAENGLSVESAHDARTDVQNTIALARILRDRQPNMWEHVYTQRTRKSAEAAVTPSDQTPQITWYINTFAGEKRAFLSAFVPVITHPTRSTLVVGVDVRLNLDELATLEPSEINRRQFMKQKELEDEGLKRPPIVEVQINASPVLAPYNVMRTQDFERLKIDRTQLEANLAKLSDLIDTGRLREKLSAAYKARSFEVDAALAASLPVETKLYDGFLSWDDLREAERARNALLRTPPLRVRPPLEDARAQPLLDRMVANGRPELQSEQEKREPREFVRNCLKHPALGLEVAEKKMQKLPTVFPRSNAKVAEMSAYYQRLRREFSV